MCKYFAPPKQLKAIPEKKKKNFLPGGGWQSGPITAGIGVFNIHLRGKSISAPPLRHIATRAIGMSSFFFTIVIIIATAIVILKNDVKDF